MKNPCTKVCPDRTPGCSCARRDAWLFCQAQAKAARNREKLLDAYQADAVKDNALTHKRRRRRKT